MSISLPVSLSVCWSPCLSVCLSVCWCPSFPPCLPVCLSPTVCLSLCLWGGNSLIRNTSVSCCSGSQCTGRVNCGRRIRRSTLGTPSVSSTRYEVGGGDGGIFNVYLFRVILVIIWGVGICVCVCAGWECADLCPTVSALNGQQSLVCQRHQLLVSHMTSNTCLSGCGFFQSNMKLSMSIVSFCFATQCILGNIISCKVWMPDSAEFEPSSCLLHRHHQGSFYVSLYLLDNGD